MPSFDIHRGVVHVWPYCAGATGTLRDTGRVLASVLFATTALWPSQDSSYVSPRRYPMSSVCAFNEQSLCLWTNDYGCCPMQSTQCEVRRALPRIACMWSTHVSRRMSCRRRVSALQSGVWTAASCMWASVRASMPCARAMQCGRAMQSRPSSSVCMWSSRKTRCVWCSTGH